MDLIEAMKATDRRSQAGFTMIELMVTLGILAMLAAVVLFAIGSSRNNAARASCRTDRATLLTAAAARDANELVYAGTGGTIESYLQSQPYYFSVVGDTVTRIKVDHVSTALCSYP